MFPNALQPLNLYILIEVGLVNNAELFVHIKTFLSVVCIDKVLPPSPSFYWGKKAEEDTSLLLVSVKEVKIKGVKG